MPYIVILHIQNTDAVMGEMDTLPTSSDNLIIVKNPRKIDGKELVFLHENAVTVMWPVERLNFVEVLSGEEEEQIISFVRE